MRPAKRGSGKGSVTDTKAETAAPSGFSILGPFVLITASNSTG
jgi:hypothetical protein